MDGEGRAGAHRQLRLNTVELLRHPGTTRDVRVDLDPAEFGLEHRRLARGPVVVALVAESTVDGIVVRGQLSVPWADDCRRCLLPMSGVEEMAVDELYQDDVSDPDAFEIGPDALDLVPLVRDGVLLALSSPPPLCRHDCAGICPVCGADRNLEPCACHIDVRDERWAVLDALRDPDELGDAGH